MPPPSAPTLPELHLPYWTYLSLTVCPCLPSCLEFLLDNGADPSLRDRQGYTAVHYAAAYGNRQNLELVRMGTWSWGKGARIGLGGRITTFRFVITKSGTVELGD